MIYYFDDFVVVTVFASIHQTHLLFPSKWDWKNLTENGVQDRDPTTSYIKQQVIVTVATFCVCSSMEKVLSSMLNIHCEGLCEQRAKNNHQHGWSMTVWDLQDATTTWFTFVQNEQDRKKKNDQSHRKLHIAKYYVTCL